MSSMLTHNSGLTSSFDISVLSKHKSPFSSKLLNSSFDATKVAGKRHPFITRKQIGLRNTINNWPQLLNQTS